MNKDNAQYALVPVGFLEIKKNISYQTFNHREKLLLKLIKHNAYNYIEVTSIAVKIALDEEPYIEELLTNKKIGLSKNINCEVYLPSQIIYRLCTKKEAYSTVFQKRNYKKIVESIFNLN